MAQLFGNFRLPGNRRFGTVLAGMVLVEAILAIGLFSLISASVWVLAFQADDISTRNDLRFAGSSFLNDILENHFFNSLSPDWAGFVGQYTGQSVESLGPDIEINGFVFENNLRGITPCLVEISENLEAHQLANVGVSGEVIVVDINEAEKLGYDCGGFPDFREINNANIDDASVLSGETNNTNGSNGENSAENLDGVQATDIDLFGENFFVSFFSNDENLPDLATGFTGKKIDFAINVGPGLNSIDVSEGIVYGAQKSTTTQVAIFDSSNLSLIATSTLPGVAGVRPEGWSIFYYDDRVYVGTKRTAGREFHVFDVKNPKNPRWLGSLEVNHNINNIVVRENLAFLATSGNVRDLIVLNVADPQNMFQISSLDLPGGEDGRSLDLRGKTLYIGRFRSTAGNPEFYIVDVGKLFGDQGYADVNEISILGSYPIFADVNSIAVQYDYAILGTTKVGSFLLILNIAS